MENKIQYLTSNFNLFATDEIEWHDKPDELIKFLDKTTEFGIDTETSGLDPHDDNIIIISLGDKNNKWVIDATSVDINFLKKYLENSSICKVLQNAKFDYKFFKNKGIILENVYDTMLAEICIFNGFSRAKQVSLSNLVDRYINKSSSLDKDIREEFIGMGKTKKLDINLKHIKYAAEDIEYLLDIKRKQLYGHSKNRGILYYGLENLVNLENEASLFYGDIEYNGIHLNSNLWKERVIIPHKKLRKQVLSKLNEILYNKYISDKKQLEEFNKKEKELQIQHDLPIVSRNPKLEESVNYLKYYINNGYAIDMFTGEPTNHVKKLKGKYTGTVEIDNTAGTVAFNWNSNKEVLFVLYNIYEYDLWFFDTKELKEVLTVRKEATIPKCSKEVQDVLEKSDYFTAFDVCETIIEYYSLYVKIEKLLSSFGDKMIDIINKNTGRIHPTVFQIGTETGRISQKQPNMQQLPATKYVRECFTIQKEDYVIVTQDYSGAEMRIMAEGAKEEALLNIFRTGQDAHSAMATLAYDVEVSKTKNKQKRQSIKRINFGLAYGATAQKFVDDFEGSIEKAQHFLDNVYFKTFPKLKIYFEHLSNSAKKNGYSLTFPPYYRRRYYEKGIKAMKYLQNNSTKDSDANIAKKDLAAVGRESKNHPIQGTSADIMKLASIKVRKYILKNNLDAKIINQVHDENVYEVHKDIVDEFVENATKLMLEAGSEIIKEIPMEVDTHVQDSWTK